jgi:hypothetical protein
LPASLAIGDEDRFSVGFGMTAGDILDENRLGPANILDRLSRHWLRREPDEIAGMTGLDGYPDLAFGLHAADAGPVAGARIDDDDRRLRRIDDLAFGRNDAHEPIIDRPGQSAAVAHELGPKLEHVGDLFLGALAKNIAALAQRIRNRTARWQASVQYSQPRPKLAVASAIAASMLSRALAAHDRALVTVAPS